MKTVQQYLKELDTEKLIDTYSYEFPFDNADYMSCKEMTIEQIHDSYKQGMYKYIEYLKSVEITEPKDGRKCLIYAQRCIGDDDLTDQSYHLIPIDELLEKGCDTESYGYELCPVSEIMGYYVADTKLTQHYIYELIADVLHETSFFGFHPQKREESIQEINDRLKNANKDLTEYVSMEELFKELGWEIERQSDDEREMYNKVIQAILDYERYSKEKELNAIINLLKNEEI